MMTNFQRQFLIEATFLQFQILEEAIPEHQMLATTWSEQDVERHLREFATFGSNVTN